MKNRAGYVRYCVIPLPRKSLPKYKKMAKSISKIWRDHGTLSYFDSIGDEVEPGKVTSFPQSVKLKKGEVIVVSCTTHKNKADCVRVMKKVMSDPRMVPFMDVKAFPFDGMRMFWGGFKTVVKF